MVLRYSPPAIGSQDLDSGAVLLSECPYFEQLVGRKILSFGSNQETDSVPSAIVRKVSCFCLVGMREGPHTFVWISSPNFDASLNTLQRVV